MPYIKKEQRDKYDELIRELAPQIVSTGELNYVVTKLIHTMLKGMGLNYNNLNGFIGVLECIKLELYRKVAAKYEDLKEKENGPV